MAQAQSGDGSGECGIEESIRQDALDVLSDVGDWTMKPAQWAQVERLLDTMAAAVAAGAGEGVRQAVVQLELVSPLRVRKVGEGPVPGLAVLPAIRERLNRLVHALGGIAAPDDEPPGFTAPPSTTGHDADPVGSADRAPTMSLISEHELVVHLFAPADGPRADDAYRQLRTLWANCAQLLGPVRPIQGVDFSETLPEALATLPALPVIAGQEGVGTGFQAILRREHDLLNLSIAFAPQWAGSEPVMWAQLTQRWFEIADGSVGALLGRAWLHLGKTAGAADSGRVEATPQLATAAAHDLPLPGAWHLGEGFTIATGLAAWEVGPGDDARAERRLVVLAPPGHDDELSAWAWSRGEPSMPPFARYLMHAAKLRYELRVYRNASPAAYLGSRLEESTNAIGELLQGVPSDHSAAGTAASRLTELRADQAKALLLTADLRNMRRTVQIAAHNMAAVLGPDAPMATSGANVLGDDAALAVSFAAQLDDEVHYLETRTTVAAKISELAAASTLHTRTRTQTQAEPPTFGIVTAMPEEFTAVRLLLEAPERRLVGGDRADYFVGTMPSLLPDQPHRVVLTLLGETGNDAAAESCAHLIRSFASVDQIVMCGIAAGIPDPLHPEQHVRLGDIVAATWGLIDYDHVVDTPDGLILRQTFPRPSALLGRRAKMLEAMDLLGERPWERWLDELVRAQPEFRRPPARTDVLHSSQDPDQILAHPDPVLSRHRPGRPRVHYGRIGSADRALRNAVTRDSLAARHQLRAVEMEGKGIGRASFAGGRDWFVVRGISDYGDSRTDKSWRHHASAVAAAYLRALLSECPPVAPHGGQTSAPDPGAGDA